MSLLLLLDVVSGKPSLGLLVPPKSVPITELLFIVIGADGADGIGNDNDAAEDGGDGDDDDDDDDAAAVAAIAALSNDEDILLCCHLT